MKIFTIKILEEIKDLTEKITDDLFIKKCALLNNNTIGQHIRHILEFYLCFFNGIIENKVNYDNRKRDINIETKRLYCLKKIDYIIEKIEKLNVTNDVIQLENNSIDGKKTEIKTTLFRELLYCLDHSIHHQATIKIALKTFDTNIVSENFGIAPATIQYQNS